MTERDAAERRVIGVEEHAWTAELRDALLKYGGDDTVNRMNNQGEISLRLLDVGEERLARMDANGVDMEVLSITTPGTQPLPPAVAVSLAREANDFPVFEAAAQLGVPLYVHPALPPRSVRDAVYGGFDDWTSLLLSTGGWGWHAEAGLSVLRLILAGTFDRHPDLQVILGHWGEMLVPFADRADVLSAGATHLERRVLDYVTGNVNVTAGGVFLSLIHI